MQKDNEDNLKQWRADEWEEYLSNIDVPLTEKLLDNPRAVENLSNEDYQKGFAQLIGQNYTPNLAKLCALIIEELTPLQKEVITQIFWQHRTLGEIARELGKSKTAIFSARDRALAQIKKKLEALQKSGLLANEPKRSSLEHRETA